MLLLVGLCGFVEGGGEGARAAIASGMLRDDELEFAPELLARRFGASALEPIEAPLLHERLREICRRAGLARPPELYRLPGPHRMNAYLLGGPARSVIVLTQGLLERMTADEAAAILAHEVAHIRNDDAWSMSFIGKLQRAAVAACSAALSSERWRGSPLAPLAQLLSTAPAIGQLLIQALSRQRELDADALAMDLIENPRPLAAALHKLERFHSGVDAARDPPQHEGPTALLRSHPSTSERVGHLLHFVG